MKKLLLFVFALLTSLFVSAQYRCIPNLDANHNPGYSTNNDFPSLNWTLLDKSLVPRWSNIVQIPFPFYFNGQLVTSLKASSTGVVTFDTTVAWVPPIGNAPLPSPMIPSKSICVWGLTAPTNNSKLVMYNYTNRTGLIPAKQLWLTFLNYSDVNDPFTGRAVTCSIVLEENSNNIYIVEQYGGLNPALTLTFGIQIDQSNAIMVPGSPYTDFNVGRNYYSGNNRYYTFYPENELSIDGEIIASSNYDYVDFGNAPYNVGAVFHNLGSDTVRTLTLNYRVNGGSTQSETFSGVSILTGEKQKFIFSLPWTPADTGVYQLDFWADIINGSTDLDTSNDHFIQRLSVAPVLPNRRIMFEEFKGTWCLWSGYWTHRYDSVLNANSSKASSIKYEETGGLPWDYNDVNRRSVFYGVWSIPTAYGNGRLLQNDSLARYDYSVYPGCPWNAVQRDIDSLYNMPGLFYVQPQLTLSGYSAHVSGTVTTAANIGNPCKMIVAIVEDSIFYGSPQGSSGETLFINTTRMLLPNNYGVPIGTPKVGRVDSLDFSFLVTDVSSSLTRLKVVVFVQDTITKEIYQCGEAPAVQTCTPVMNLTHYDMCGGDSVLANGVWRNQSGTYPTILTSANGCDSLQLDVIREHVLWCQLGKYNGQIGASAYSYYNTDTITWAWFDSTSLQMVPGVTTRTFYPTYAANYCAVMTNQMGCTFMSQGMHTCTTDSIDMTTLQFDLCQGDSILVAGRYCYSNDATTGIWFTNVFGCDSGIIVHITQQTINATLTIAGPHFSVPTGYATYQWHDCNTGLPISGAVTNTFVGDSINGGNYYCQITNTTGCVKNSFCASIASCSEYLQAQQFIFCEGDSVYAMQQWFSSPGFYYDTIAGSGVCDTMMMTEIIQYAFNTNLNVIGNTITAQAGYISYQWIDCQSGLAVVGQSSTMFTPTATGNYAAVLESAEGCIEQTPCVYVLLNGIDQITSQEITLWPNPANHSFEIKLPDNASKFYVDIIDLNGRVLKQEITNNSSTAQISVSEFASGLYSVNVYSEKGFVGRKVLAIVK
ncbi:MAG: T9SS type A sorting domain-containing protein [Bacteroidia bacterium]|nr:T9SS type A sorting domain-containing protein [Bacteroidia bacterium]